MPQLPSSVKVPQGDEPVPGGRRGVAPRRSRGRSRWGASARLISSAVRGSCTYLCQASLLNDTPTPRSSAQPGRRYLAASEPGLQLAHARCSAAPHAGHRASGSWGSRVLGFRPVPQRGHAHQEGAWGQCPARSRRQRVLVSCACRLMTLASWGPRRVARSRVAGFLSPLWGSCRHRPRGPGSLLTPASRALEGLGAVTGPLLCRAGVATAPKTQRWAAGD